MPMPRTIVAGVAACLLLAAACGDEGDSSDSSGSDGSGGSGGVCDTLEGFDSTVDEVTGTGGDRDGDTTVSDLEDAIDEFQSDLSDVQNDDNDLPEGVASALDTAARGLEDAISDLPTDEALDDAGAAIESARSALASAWTDMLDALDARRRSGTAAPIT